jgi:hypothetical protein
MAGRSARLALVAAALFAGARGDGAKELTSDTFQAELDAAQKGKQFLFVKFLAPW